jgi:hypothetical protein
MPMSLKLVDKRFFIKIIAGIALMLNTSFVYAEHGVSHDFQVHGFIAQGLIDVDGSDYVNDSGDLSAELTEIGLNASYQLGSTFRLAGQIVYLDGGNRYSDGFRVDYALIDWSAYSSVNWQANVYLGRYKNIHWLHSGTRDVPHTRPSIILPQGIYFDGFRDIAVGGDGLAMKVTYGSDKYGDFDLNFSTGSSSISDEQTKIIMSDFAQGKLKQVYDVQGSFYWRPENTLWRLGLSLLDSDFEYKANSVSDNFIDSNITLQLYTLNAFYEGEKWEFSSEIFQQRFLFDGFYFDGFHNDQFGRGAYVQTRYKMNNMLTFLLRYDRYYANKDDKNGKMLEATLGIPNYFAYQHDLTLGLSYDIKDNLRVQFEYHDVNGTSRLTPVILPNVQLNTNENWDFWAIQLMYWF